MKRNGPHGPHGGLPLKGFTLLEVMIALAIAGGALVVLLYSISFHLNLIGDQRTRTVAAMLCRERLETLRQIPAGPPQGAFDAPFEDYRYQTSIGNSAFDGLSVLNATVSSGQTSVSLRELVRTRELSQ